MRSLFVFSCLFACLHSAFCSENIPSSFEATAEDGAKISVLTKDYSHANFELIGSGFEPNESVCFVSTSCDEITGHPISIDEQGNFPIMFLLPAVIGWSEGTCDVFLFRKSGQIHISFPWSMEN